MVDGWTRGPRVDCMDNDVDKSFDVYMKLHETNLLLIRSEEQCEGIESFNESFEYNNRYS